MKPRRPFPTPYLDAWEDEIARGERTADLHDEVWRRACEERSTLEAHAAKAGTGGVAPGRGEPTRGKLTAISRSIADVKPEVVRWLFPGRIPLGKLTILEGDPGLGKSTVLADLAARVTRGEGLPGEPPYEPGGVIVLSAEDGLADTVRPRLDAAGADCHRTHTLDGFEDDAGKVTRFTIGDPRESGMLVALEELIVKENVRLVTIDVLTAYLSGSRDAYRDHDVRQALSPLTDLAERTGCAIVCVRHLRKGGAGNAISAGGGSIGIAGAARSVLLTDRDPEDPDRRVLAVVKSNLSAPVPSLSFSIVTSDSGTSRIEWHGQSTQTADSLTLARAAEGKSERPQSKAEECAECLREWLAEGPMERRAVLKLGQEHGFSPSTTERAADSIPVRKKANGFGQEKTSTWSLPSIPSEGPNPVRSSSPETLMEMEGLDRNEDERLELERAIERDAIEREDDPC